MYTYIRSCTDMRQTERRGRCSN